jgi:uncharacterized membrane protein (UPF0127 family)
MSPMLGSRPYAYTVRLATSFFARVVGLLDRKICANGEVLVLAPCNSIHTFGMCESLDVAFVDKDGRVRTCARALKPGKTLKDKQAVCVLERRTRADEPWFEPGEILELTSVPPKGEQMRPLRSRNIAPYSQVLSTGRKSPGGDDDCDTRRTR